MCLVRQGVKGGRLYNCMKGKARSLNTIHYCTCIRTKLRFSDRMLRIQKNLPKSLHHGQLSYTTKPSQDYRSMFPLTFDFSETGSFQRCFHLARYNKEMDETWMPLKRSCNNMLVKLTNLLNKYDQLNQPNSWPLMCRKTGAMKS